MRNDAARAVGETRRQNRPLLVARAAGVGLFTGFLANGSAGSTLAHRIEAPSLRRAFGWFLVAFGTYSTIYRLVHG